MFFVFFVNKEKIAEMSLKFVKKWVLGLFLVRNGNYCLQKYNGILLDMYCV
jgi:hypothetical protein